MTCLPPARPLTGDTAGTRQPGAILSVRQAGTPAVVAYAGLASVELAVPISEDTVFNTGSVAKQITAYLLIRAARDQALSLQRPVSDLLPRFRLDDVTVADLIQHHGGVRDAESLLSLAGFRDLDHSTADDLLELAYRQHSRAVPLGQFLYSNTGYLLLAEILHSVRGAGLQELADRQIFTPLGMASTRFQSDTRHVIPGAAASYRLTRDGWSKAQRPVALPGPGTLWSSAADIDRWLAHLHQERADASSLPSAADLSYRPSDHHPFTYGPGLYADPRQHSLAVFHNGHEQGFSAATHLTSAGTRITCLSNNAEIAADHIASAALAQLTHRQSADPAQIIAAALSGLARAATQTENHPAPAHEQEHTPLGTYKCDEVPGILRLTLSAGQLYLWRRGTSHKLSAISPQAYKGDGYVLTIPAAAGSDRPHGFALDLDRAPGLWYQLQA